MTGRKETEAEANLKRMFGDKEELNLSIVDRQKLSMIKSCYKSAPIIFKIFFDKMYRP